MAEHKDKLNCVMLGVGAAYDFIAGSKKHAPRWVQKIGMEWLFRLFSEPKRLWRRYLSTNPRFIWHFGKQYFKYLIK
jgi:N-acetylglucosaminyldiphosphoundecaprenol N-acetyl-beta-D-mannosaminyltransferase